MGGRSLYTGHVANEPRDPSRDDCVFLRVEWTI